MRNTLKNVYQCGTSMGQLRAYLSPGLTVKRSIARENRALSTNLKLVRKDWSHLEKFRHVDRITPSSVGCTFGAFQIPSGTSSRSPTIILNVIATDGFDGDEDTGWEHVSVHALDRIFGKQRIPNWTEMDFIKDLFWEPTECVVQFHVPKSDHVNINPNVLHLWRCKAAEFPLPPKEFV
jgi:hypothetical protein